MKVLILGSGGREHAIGIKLSQSPHRPQLHFAPGNPGMEALGICHPLAADAIPELLELAKREGMDLTIVGPEVPLVKGIVDTFQKAGMRVFGPTAHAARLEGSKVFSKEFMIRHHIPTAAYQSFSELAPALQFLKKIGVPVVVKASGLCAGKGAVVCTSLEEAETALTAMLGPEAIFGEAGKNVVVEEFMAGEEASVFAICDGKGFTLLPTAQDHKRAFDGDQGPNTGGMGAYAPAPIMTPALLEEVGQTIITPTLDGMRAEGYPYTGVLYVGVMVTPEGPKVVEFNCRFGDPETQDILPVYTGDFLRLLCDSSSGGSYVHLPFLPPTPGHHYQRTTAAVVILASGGYPGEYSTGFPIHGLESQTIEETHIIHAGTRRENGECKTAGGRVLGVVGVANNLSDSLAKAYQAINLIHFEGMHYRRDIGHRGRS